MGTTVEFSIASAGKNISQLKNACDIAESRIASLDAMLSIFNKSSVVSKINSDTGKSVIGVPQELFYMVKKAKEYFVLTQGTFDITVEPLTKAWGFGPENTTLPDILVINEALRHVGLDKIELDDKNKALIFKDPGVRMDFGGLAKGYAVDEAVKILRKHGIKNGLVNIGGDLYCMGVKPDGEDWSIGIRNPDNKDEILAILEISDKAVATSGTYENFYIHDEERYMHIIDPRTGYTVTNNIASATIIADNCATADALGTAVFVLGETQALELIEKLSDIECLLVVDRGDGLDIMMSSGMKRFLKE